MMMGVSYAEATSNISTWLVAMGVENVPSWLSSKTTEGIFFYTSLTIGIVFMLWKIFIKVGLISYEPAKIKFNRISFGFKKSKSPQVNIQTGELTYDLNEPYVVVNIPPVNLLHTKVSCEPSNRFSIELTSNRELMITKRSQVKFDHFEQGEQLHWTVEEWE